MAPLELTRRIKNPQDRDADAPMPRLEWLVANGLGGYASGTVAGVVTRRYHGLLVASLPAPLGRMVLLNHLLERLRLGNGHVAWLGDEGQVAGTNAIDRGGHLIEFRLDLGLPVWVYDCDGLRIEKRLLMPHGHNTTYMTYRLLSGKGPIRLTLRPSIHFRSYEAPVTEGGSLPYTVNAVKNHYEVCAGPGLPVLRLRLHGERAALTLDEVGPSEVSYSMERLR